MTTNNPRISSYVKQQTFDKIERFCNEQNISRSEGINQILEGFFATQKEGVQREKVGLGWIEPSRQNRVAKS